MSYSNHEPRVDQQMVARSELGQVAGDADTRHVFEQGSLDSSPPMIPNHRDALAWATGRASFDNVV